MELELGQLDLRYGSLYAREKRGEKQAVAAVSAELAGPVVVVREGDRWVVVEGFATVRARHRLKHDTVEATVWETGSAEGLALRERLRRGRRPSAVEEGWLVTHLARTEGWSPEESVLSAAMRDRTSAGLGRREGPSIPPMTGAPQ